MANLSKYQEEAIAVIDVAKAIEKVIPVTEYMASGSLIGTVKTKKPIEFLVALLKSLGVSYEDLQDWLVKFLVYVVPILEISVKTILLTNLKNMISCSVDPRIPEVFRKQHKSITSDTNTSQEYGIDINIESIDFMDKLSVSPLSDYGKTVYFGTEGVDDSYKFARAEDFDAFLWFVIHKGKFPTSSKVPSPKPIFPRASTIPSDCTLLSTIELIYSQENPSSVLLGNTFTYENESHIVSMCIDAKYDEENNMTHNTLVPVSDDWSSVNWYANKKDYFTKNLGFKDIKKSWGGKTNSGRDFTKERALCNLQYIDQASSTAPLTGLVNNKFRFTILPRPFVHIPNINSGEPPWRFKKMLFNDKGEYDLNGKYTLSDRKDSNAMTYLNGAIKIDGKTGKVTVNDKQTVVKNLIECYPGLTVYEFNYDYVMSLKLFDAKVIATNLLNALLNMDVGIGFEFKQRRVEGLESIKEIIKNIINTDDSELNDCYYTFDNSKYDALLRKAEEKRARQARFGNTTQTVGIFDSVTEILNEYNADAELHERIDTLHRAITQASVNITDGVDDVNKYDIRLTFISNLIENLVMVLVESILTPKVLLLLEVNTKLMGGTWEKFTMQDLIMAMRSIIVSIIKEVKDLVMQELLKLIFEKLQPIKELLEQLLMTEVLEQYRTLINDLMVNCPYLWFKLFSGGNNIDTQLDNVDYADIDISSSPNGEQPSTNKC